MNIFQIMKTFSSQLNPKKESRSLRMPACPNKTSETGFSEFY